VYGGRVKFGLRPLGRFGPVGIGYRPYN